MGPDSREDGGQEGVLWGLCCAVLGGGGRAFRTAEPGCTRATAAPSDALSGAPGGMARERELAPAGHASSWQTEWDAQARGAALGCSGEGGPWRAEPGLMDWLRGEAVGQEMERRCVDG